MPDIPQTQRSTFVTVVAWIFIVILSFASLISVLQNIMIQVMFSSADMQTAMEASKQADDVPVFAQFMFNNIRLFFLTFLFASIGGLVASIGLLKRKNWARIAFISLMVLGIVWNLGGFVMQLVMVINMPQMPAGAGGNAEFESQFMVMSTAIIVVGGIMALAFSILFGWIIKRLISPEIKREFLPVAQG